MKKVLIGTLAVVLVLTAITAGAFAAGRGHGSCFVDANRDGVCDNYGTARHVTVHGSNYADIDNDGVCDNCGASYHGCGLGFVDADGDGLCDNAPSGGWGAGCGAGWGHGAGLLRPPRPVCGCCWEPEGITPCWCRCPPSAWM